MSATSASDGFVVEQAVIGSGSGPWWRVRMKLEWGWIATMEFARERPDGPVAVCLRLSDLPTRRVLDAAPLSADQWKEIAAVAAHTHRRLFIDLSGWFPGDAHPGDDRVRGERPCHSCP